MKPKKNVLEWSVFAASGLLVAAVFVVLVLSGIKGGQTPPSIHIATGRPERVGDQYRLPVTVSNSGDMTAADVKIEVELTAEGSRAEVSELTIPFVPKRSSRHAWVVFGRDPACCTIDARATAFNVP